MNKAKDYQPFADANCVGLSEPDARAAEIEAMCEWARSNVGVMAGRAARWLLIQHNVVAATLKRRERTIERLQAIVAKLPKTFDDVPISLGDFLWRLNADGRIIRCQIDGICDDCLTVCDDGQNGIETFHYLADGPWFFSTREAAEAEAADLAADAKKHAPSGASTGAAPESPTTDKGK